MAKSKFLVGLIGEGIQASLSPALHEEEARCQGLTLHYRLIDLARDGSSVADLPRLIDSAEAAGFDGLNITHPCKQGVRPSPTPRWRSEWSSSSSSTGTASAPNCLRAESLETTPAGRLRQPTSSHLRRNART